MWSNSWFGGRANIVHMALWIGIFVAMSMLGKTDGRHTGDSMPFWANACSEQRSNACDRLLQLQTNYCADNAAWACNELGLHYRRGDIVAADREQALDYFSQSCELKFKAGCLNLLNEDSLIADNPHELDLRLLLRQGGLNLMGASPAELHRRACEHGWEFACALEGGNS